MSTTPMTQLFALVLKKDSKRVTETILREGVMQFISETEFDAAGMKNLSTVQPGASLEEVSDLRKRIEGFLHAAGVVPAMPHEYDLNNRVLIDIDKENKFLDKIDGEREGVRERQKALNQEILKLEEIKRQLQIYGSHLSGVSIPSQQSMLSVRTGQLPASNVKQLDDSLKQKPVLNITLGQEDNVVHNIVISMKRDSDEIDKLLSVAGWHNLKLSRELVSGGEKLLQEIPAKIKGLTDEQKKLQTQANNLVKKEKGCLTELWVNLRVNELCYKIQANFKSSSRTVIFAGWLPISKKDKLNAGITKASQGRCYLEWHQPGTVEAIGDEIPVQLNNPKILAPFQLLVKNFGIPKYGTIDPTLFVMPIYLVMFGLMFCDFGQGLVLVLLGLGGASAFKKKEDKESFHQLSWLVIWCGMSAMLFGLLFGSYFGFRLFNPLWFDFHGIVSGHNQNAPDSVIHSIYDILRITVYFGISVIFLGLTFNWINVFREGKWMELFFDKGGIMGGWIYGGGIYISYYLVSHEYKEFPDGGIIFMLVGLPAILLFIGQPYHYFKQSKAGTGYNNNFLLLLSNFLMQWVVELLEIFSGYLSNTLSFMRVAGLGIAHVCLMMSFFTLAAMTSGVYAVLILIAGNVMVIALEGLTAGIQALRLTYYEFFTKFFHGTGKLHTPISLNSKL